MGRVDASELVGRDPQLRDAIRKLGPVLPELADHLERSIVTGTYCRYRTRGPAG